MEFVLLPKEEDISPELSDYLVDQLNLKIKLTSQKSIFIKYGTIF